MPWSNKKSRRSWSKFWTRILNSTGTCKCTWRHLASHLSSTEAGENSQRTRWVLHKLTPENKNRHYDIAFSLLSRFKKNDFLHKIVWWKIDIVIILRGKNHGFPAINEYRKTEHPCKKNFIMHLVGSEKHDPLWDALTWSDRQIMIRQNLFLSSINNSWFVWITYLKKKDSLPAVGEGR